jgi:hypothetical protein
MFWLAEIDTVEELKHGYGSLIFMGCFILVAITAFVWWLRRG